MAKEKKEKSSKKDKSLSKQSADGVKKSKKEKSTGTISPENADKILQEIENNAAAGAVAAVDADESMLDASVVVNGGRPLGALVPFANPLADEKVAKKVFKSVKKANKAKALKRGVKEVVKSLRKSPLASVSNSNTALPSGVVVIAADISPMDVISHLPVLCEDHGVPYVYVTSRAELGAAGATKRPTSVVLVGREKGKVKEKKSKEGKEDKEDEKEEWSETFAELVKVVKKAGRDVRI